MFYIFQAANLIGNSLKPKPRKIYAALIPSESIISNISARSIEGIFWIRKFVPNDICSIVKLSSLPPVAHTHPNAMHKYLRKRLFKRTSYI